MYNKLAKASKEGLSQQHHSSGTSSSQLPIPGGSWAALSVGCVHRGLQESCSCKTQLSDAWLTGCRVSAYSLSLLSPGQAQGTKASSGRKTFKGNFS